MPYLAALDLRGRRCLVAGGGAVARRKAAGLLAAGASVHVVAPHVEGMPADVVVERRAALPGDLEGVTLLVCATDDPQVNAVLATEAHRRGVLVNVVDDPGSGSFTVPAVLRRGRLQVGVSTGGASPSLAARIRDELAVVVDEPYGELVALLGELRAEWEPRAVLELPLLELLRQGDGCEARVRAEGVLEDALGSAG